MVLNIAGIIFKRKGYINEIEKLNRQFLRYISWVLLYTAQKAEIKYQQKLKYSKPIIKNILNLISKYLNKFIDLL